MSNKAGNLPAIYLLLGLVCLVCALIALLVLLDTLETWDDRTATIILVFGSIGAWRFIWKARKMSPPPQEAEESEDYEIASVLDKLGIPLDWTVSDPQTALMYGVVKTGIFMAYKDLKAGRQDEAIITLDRLAQSAPDPDATNLSKAYGVAHFLKGQALEKQGHSENAAAAYHQVLEYHPEHLGARKGVERLST